MSKKVLTPKEFLEKFGDQLDPNTIAHWGVKGMKWGVRRSRKERTSDSRSQKRANKNALASTRERRRNDIKNRRKLSDKSLEAKIKRLESEKKLKSLMEEDVSPGRSFIKRVLTKSGESAANKIVSGAMLYAVKAAGEGKFDFKEATKYMAPKPKSK